MEIPLCRCSFEWSLLPRLAAPITNWRSTPCGTSVVPTQDWMDLFLRHYESYLEGAKAPDDQFKDFRNHVCMHNKLLGRGGRYGTRVTRQPSPLSNGGNWEERSTPRVLSRIYSDPLMPFHTGQSEAEGAVSRAVSGASASRMASCKIFSTATWAAIRRLECPKGKLASADNSRRWKRRIRTTKPASTITMSLSA